MSDITKSWTGLYEHRKKIRRMFPNFWRVKIIKKHFDALRPYLKAGVKILDVGAGNKQIEGKIKAVCPGAIYKSMDIDRTKSHDYYSLDDIKERFDCIAFFEVIEHLTFEEAVIILRKIKDLLKPGGIFILTTPNVYHPNRYWEYSHKVSYRYDELAGLLSALGLKIENIYRIYNDAIIRRFARLYIMSHVHYYLGIDFARSIAIIAKNQ